MRHELIHALQIPAALSVAEAVGSCQVISQQAGFLALEIFALHFYIAVGGIAVGRVFPDEINASRPAVTAEAVAHAACCAWQVGHGIADCRNTPRLVQRYTGTPTVFDAYIVANMGEQHAGP